MRSPYPFSSKVRGLFPLSTSPTRYVLHFSKGTWYVSSPTDPERYVLQLPSPTRCVDRFLLLLTPQGTSVFSLPPRCVAYLLFLLIPKGTSSDFLSPKVCGLFLFPLTLQGTSFVPVSPKVRGRFPPPTNRARYVLRFSILQGA